MCTFLGVLLIMSDLHCTAALCTHQKSRQGCMHACGLIACMGYVDYKGNNTTGLDWGEPRAT